MDTSEPARPTIATPILYKRTWAIVCLLGMGPGPGVDGERFGRGEEERYHGPCAGLHQPRQPDGQLPHGAGPPAARALRIQQRVREGRALPVGFPKTLWCFPRTVTYNGWRWPLFLPQKISNTRSKQLSYATIATIWEVALLAKTCMTDGITNQLPGSNQLRGPKSLEILVFFVQRFVEKVSNTLAVRSMSLLVDTLLSCLRAA